MQSHLNLHEFDWNHPTISAGIVGRGLAAVCDFVTFTGAPFLGMHAPAPLCAHLEQ